MIKHIFCDLDGTLFNKGISDEDAKAIEEIEKEGVKFHIATGRVFKQAYNMVNSKFKLNGYYICENGSFIYDENKNLIFKETINDYLVKKLISKFKYDDAYMYLKYKGDMVIGVDKKEIVREYSMKYIVDEGILEKETYDGLVGNVGILSGDKNLLKRIEYYYKSEFSDVCDIYMSSPITINILPNHVSKRHSIEKICQLHKINLDEVATMGDSPNDICMLKDLKYSFAMEGAVDEVKNEASYVMKNVREGIEMIKNINREK